MRNAVDLPNRHADLFLRLCLQNQGRLSKSKRQMDEYIRLTEAEITGLELSVIEAFGLKSKP